MSRAGTSWLLLLLLAGAGRAGAEATQLRIGSVAPDGSGWARELRGLADYVAAESKGSLSIKLYLNAVAGDELQMGDRVRRGQLDGVASGQMLCQELAPTMRVLRLPGLFQNRDETNDVMATLQPLVEAEARQAGFVMLGSAGLGSDIFFTRVAVHTLAELRSVKMWRWDVDRAAMTMSREMGFQMVPKPLYEARPAYLRGDLDGFVAAPSAALAFQWSAEAHYVLDLVSAYLYGCLVLSERAYQKLTPAEQTALRAGTARTLVGIEELGRKQDAQLLGGLFQKQGLQVVPVSPAFRAEYFAAAKAARDRLGERLVPRALLERVLRLLADYRLEHTTDRE